jgi:ketosteroid isomerase-like protein
MTMKRLAILLVLSLAAPPLLAAPPPENDVAETVAAFVDAVNAGNRKAALACFAPDAAITDDLAPFRWQGPAAAAQWLDAMERNGRHQGFTSVAMHLGRPVQVQVVGDRAYEAIAGTVSLKSKGRPLHESGLLTFALRKIGGKWKIGLMSWGGEKATP